MVSKIFFRIKDILRDIFFGFIIKNLKGKKKFEYIYAFNYWKGGKSLSKSGYGSELENTKQIIKSLNKFIKNYKIKTILDIPCGDFNWFQKMEFNNLNYTGADIVRAMIDSNNEKYCKKNVNFKLLDLLNDDLGDYDLIFNRDCLIHFNDKEIFKALKNISKTKSKFFATTTYLSSKTNSESRLADNWRPLNLMIKPFELDSPIEILDDSSNENDTTISKKILIYELPLPICK
jgi:2-polyprenyl-3-methyl-5-hydroxy-6-metoxy-1,4-benzoquinol methylase